MLSWLDNLGSTISLAVDADAPRCAGGQSLDSIILSDFSVYEVVVGVK